MIGLSHSSPLTPQGRLLLMPGSVCVWGTFRQIQVAAQPSVQLKRGCVCCLWAGSKWAQGRGSGSWICCSFSRWPGAGLVLSLKGKE